jgi:hypothetical protein
MKKIAFILLTVFAAAIFGAVMYAPIPVNASCMPAATVTPSNFDFPDTAVGSKSATTAFTITNTSASTCYLSSMTIYTSGDDYSFFNC